jgi:hypothetical protein
MIHLLWGLLNVGLFIFFIVICFRATKLIREKLGLLAAIVFVFGLLSFMGNTHADNDNKEPDTNRIRSWKFHSPDSLLNNSQESIDLVLEKNIISQYNVDIAYGQDKSTKLNVPISAYSILTGFTGGTKWKPHSIIVNATDDNTKFEYQVDGTVEWKLLGTTFYSQAKTYSGLALTK